MTIDTQIRQTRQIDIHYSSNQTDNKLDGPGNLVYSYKGILSKKDSNPKF